MLYEINDQYRSYPISYDTFTIADLTDTVNIQQDYVEKLLNQNVSVSVKTRLPSFR